MQLYRLPKLNNIFSEMAGRCFGTFKMEWSSIWTALFNTSLHSEISSV